MHQVDVMHTHTDLSEWEGGGGKGRDTTKRYKRRIAYKEEPASLTCSSTARTASQQNLDQGQSRTDKNFLFLNRHSFPLNQYFLAGQY